jgi:hypothetical protein
MGQLHIDILINGIWTNDITPPLSGNKGNDWQELSVNLDAYVGNIVNIRFRGITGMGYRSDMAIDNININSTLSINPVNSNKLTLYPNPTNGQLFYEMSYDENANIQIIDANGKIVHNQNNLQSKGEIDLMDLAKGIYFVRLTTDNTTSVQKVIIE